MAQFHAVNKPRVLRFLTPEQRLDAVEEILAILALRAVNQDKEAHGLEPVPATEEEAMLSKSAQKSKGGKARQLKK